MDLTSLSSLPKNWKLEPITKFVKSYRGGAPLKPTDFVENGFSVIPKKAVIPGGQLTIPVGTETYCKHSFALQYKRSIVDKTYLITTLRDLVPTGPAIGLIVNIPDDKKYILSQGVYGFILTNGLDRNYLVQLSNTSIYRRTMQKLMVGSTQVHIRTGEFFDIKIPLPPLPEQKRIAEILGTWDEAITATQRLIKAQEERKKGLMQWLLTGQVRLKGFEGEWEEVQLGKVAKVIMGQSPSSDNYNTENKGIPLIQGNADIKNRRTFPRNYTTQITKTCNIGDIILSVRAPVGETAISFHNACIGRGVCAIQAIKLNNQFLYQLLLSIESTWDKYAQGTTFTAINSNVIKPFKLLVPETRAEQKAIAEILQTADEEIRLNKQKLAALQTQKKGLMQQLLTGQVRV